MSLLLKKKVQKEVREAGRAGLIDSKAFNLLVEYVAEAGEELELVHRVLELATLDGRTGEAVSAQQMQDAISKLRGEEPALQAVAVISAFDVPKVRYDPVQKKWHADEEPRGQLATADAKHRVYLDRLQLVHQRMRRHRMFQQHSLVSAGPGRPPGAQLTDLQALKGVVGEPRIVMGCISQLEDGRHVLEDITASVPLDLSACQTTAGFFTENCIVIAEGELAHDGVLHVRALGFPPTEPREALALSGQRLNFFGGPALSPDEMDSLMVEEMGHAEARIVLLANCWLDRPEVLDRLATVFAGFQGCPQLPAMFVLMGDFCSRACNTADVHYGSVRDSFTALANLIDGYPRLRAGCRWVFMPGPNDPGLGRVLPQAPLPQYLTAELRAVLPEAVFATNPCRIRFYTHQIVLFRQDLLQRLRRRCLLPPKDDGGGAGDSADAMFGQLAVTLLQQSHLCPLPLMQQPIFWQYDHALHVYPLPHAVVVADCSPQAQYKHQDCVVLNPGSLVDGYFAAYLPGSRTVEMSAIPGAAAQEEEEEEQGAEGGEQQEEEEEERGLVEAMEEAHGDDAAAPQGEQVAVQEQGPTDAWEAAGDDVDAAAREDEEIEEAETEEEEGPVGAAESLGNDGDAAAGGALGDEQDPEALADGTGPQQEDESEQPVGISALQEAAADMPMGHHDDEGRQDGGTAMQLGY